MNMWDEFQIENGETINWKIGSLSLWMEHRDEEYLISQANRDEDANVLSTTQVRDHEDVPEDLSWNHYIVQDPSIKFQLVPALPDRAVVVSPEFPIKLAPNSDVVFYLSIPVWVQIMVGNKKKALFMEIPSLVLSNTWFGDAMTGELCYALTTRALRKVEDHGDLRHRIICPVRILNRGAEPLDFQNLCVHVEHLRVFSGAERLWSNDVSIIYVGDEQPNEIRYEDKIPQYAKECVILSSERVPSQKSIISRSFSFIKSFTTFD
jgi:hypothetical protein